MSLCIISLGCLYSINCVADHSSIGIKAIGVRGDGFSLKGFPIEYFALTYFARTEDGLEEGKFLSSSGVLSFLDFR